MPAHFLPRRLPLSLAAAVAAYNGPVTVCPPCRHTRADAIATKQATGPSEIARCIAAIA